MQVKTRWRHADRVDITPRLPPYGSWIEGECTRKVGPFRRTRDDHFFLGEKERKGGRRVVSSEFTTGRCTDVT
jgi:hypothetical protein